MEPFCQEQNGLYAVHSKGRCQGWHQTTRLTSLGSQGNTDIRYPHSICHLLPFCAEVYIMAKKGGLNPVRL